MSTYIEQKMNNCLLNVMKGIKQAVANDYQSAMSSFRNMCEAVMKALIFNHFGESDGCKIVKGMMNAGRRETGRRYNLSFKQLHNIVSSLQLLDEEYINALDSIADKANNCGSHDTNNPELSPEAQESHLNEVIDLSRKITSAVYGKLGLPVPVELERAFEERVVDDSYMNRLNIEERQEIVQDLDCFDSQTRFVLISPPSFNGVTKEQLRILSQVNWSFVIDFNPSTKQEGGLYHAFMPEIENNSTPLTIDDLSHTNKVSNSTNGCINWVYANGLATMPSTKTRDVFEWISKRYHTLIKKLFRSYFLQKTSRVNVVCLYDDYDYVSHIVKSFDDIEEVEKDLVDFTFLSTKAAFLSKVEELSIYGFGINAHNAELSAFLSIIADNSTDRGIPVCKTVPGRVGSNATVVDITDLYPKLISQGVEPVYIGIASGAQNNDPVPGFFKGETITWNELASDTDARREVYQELLTKVREKLSTCRSSKKFMLWHRPGAGGSTLARRLAYDLHRTYPVLLLTGYKSVATLNSIEHFSLRVSMPVLAIVESSVTGNIDELVKECNGLKRTVLFVIVDRETRSANTVTDRTFYCKVNDMMASTDEKARFLSKVRQYRPAKVETLNNIVYSQSEVIDFAMSIGEEKFSTKQIESYVLSYSELLSDNVSLFLCYVSLIYHYAQKPVSDMLFRKMFDGGKGRYGLKPYLDRHPLEKKALNKLIVEGHDQEKLTGLWRPRFSRFADVILKRMLGGEKENRWKDYLPQYSIDLITKLKENNQYINDEVASLLNSVFLCRGKEDPLGMEEKWESAATNDKFSLILEDISFLPEEQKRILKALTDAYPEESHFWGHLARYCYEKADSLSSFEEADEYATKAMGDNVCNDYVILHVAGMCKRRIIEYYKRNNEILPFDKLRKLTEESQYYFSRSRELKEQNIHAYVSEIQLLTIVIEYGKQMSDFKTYIGFLTHPGNEWFLELYGRLQNITVEAHMLIGQLRTLGIDMRLRKSTRYITMCEERSCEFMGDYASSLNLLREKIDEADRTEKPKLRLMYVNTLLRSKTADGTRYTDDSWHRLTPNEVKLVGDYLNSNIMSGGDNAFSLRLWFEYVRFTDNDFSEEEIKSRLSLLYRNSDSEPMLRLEAAYYLYVITAVRLICDNDGYKEDRIKEIEEYQEYCKKHSANAKFCYEWLETLDGFRGLLDYRYKTDDRPLVRLEGTISSIRTHVQGYIELPCGLKAFFSPSMSNFVEGRDETTQVSFCIGFRHECIYATDIMRIDTEEQLSLSVENENHIDVIDDMESQEVIAEEPLAPAKPQPKSIELFKTESEKPKELKILGKMDVSKYKKW